MASACDPDRGCDSAPRLWFLDGLRGLAALYVVLHHAALMVPPEGLAGVHVPARFLLRHGRYAVAVFIVLSGFCLMLPVARDRAGRLPGGLFAFFRRRVVRIVPAYYAALALCLLLVALVPAMAEPAGRRWERALPAWGQGIVASHLFLVHNLSDRWLFKIDPPMWSVATEWQIYAGFPALLWIWRRAGTATTVVVGFTCGALVAALSFAVRNPALRELCPWYLGLFAMGMCAAVASCETRRPKRSSRGNGVRAAGVLVMVGLLLASALRVTSPVRYLMVADGFVGALTAGLLVRWTRSCRNRPTPLVRLFECRWAVLLGAFSYSLYLTHYPLLALADAALRGAGAGPGERFWTLCLGASPLCVAAAYLFHRAFERPFLTSRIAAHESGVPRPHFELAALHGPDPSSLRDAYGDHRSES